ncbi:MAG: CopD family protein [Alphaproteobacteria bacterium]|nr:CopD family protein [Alphaproteobacteria bacterium]
MTIDALLPVYRELLALHVISVIVWMAGMITLPIIYARHTATVTAVARDAGFVELERAIIKRIVNPAMYAAWGFGILLIATPGAISWSAPWWWTKLVAVLALSGYHGALSAWRRGLRDGTDRHSAPFYTIVTLIPIGLVVLIVTMVIIRP